MNLLHMHQNTSKIPFSSFGILMAAMLLSTSIQAKESISYTSLKEADCQSPGAALLAKFEEKDLTAQRCPGVAGVSAFAVSTGERSWLDFSFSKTLWSSERIVVNSDSGGYFPNIGTGQIEWHLDGSGQPRSAIFRVASQNPENPNKRISKLFVVRFSGNKAYYCGNADTNLKARALLQDDKPCAEPLEARTLP